MITYAKKAYTYIIYVYIGFSYQREQQVALSFFSLPYYFITAVAGEVRWDRIIAYIPLARGVEEKITCLVSKVVRGVLVSAGWVPYLEQRKRNHCSARLLDSRDFFKADKDIIRDRLCHRYISKNTHSLSSNQFPIQFSGPIITSTTPTKQPLTFHNSPLSTDSPPLVPRPNSSFSLFPISPSTLCPRPRRDRRWWETPGSQRTSRHHFWTRDPQTPWWPRLAVDRSAAPAPRLWKGSRALWDLEGSQCLCCLLRTR